MHEVVALTEPGCEREFLLQADAHSAFPHRKRQRFSTHLGGRWNIILHICKLLSATPAGFILHKNYRQTCRKRSDTCVCNSSICLRKSCFSLFPSCAMTSASRSRSACRNCGFSRFFLIASACTQRGKTWREDNDREGVTHTHTHTHTYNREREREREKERERQIHTPTERECVYVHTKRLDMERG